LQLWVIQHASDRFGQRGGIPGRYEESGLAFVDDFRNTPDAARDDGHSGAVGLATDDAVGFEPDRGKGENARLQQMILYRAVRDASVEYHARSEIE